MQEYYEWSNSEAEQGRYNSFYISNKTFVVDYIQIGPFKLYDIYIKKYFSTLYKFYLTDSIIGNGLFFLNKIYSSSPLSNRSNQGSLWDILSLGANANNPYKHKNIVDGDLLLLSNGNPYNPSLGDLKIEYSTSNFESSISILATKKGDSLIDTAWLQQSEVANVLFVKNKKMDYEPFFQEIKNDIENKYFFINVIFFVLLGIGIGLVIFGK